MSNDRTIPGDSPSEGRSDPERGGFGNYRLLRKIGEGGMGEVHEAEQQWPVKRKVAVKLIKMGMDTKRVIARFESERQTLALMNHANIARVFDAGATDEGRPYFVMEFVDGAPIDEYCKRAGLSTNEKLELLIEACSGIQHAHQKGIIHRDLKPSNILVIEQDGVPLPKIIDFGIAKATREQDDGRTAFTESGQLIGTPAYMSPEQAEGGLDIDTRSDVYALGVLLYELLVGEVPFDVSDMGVDEMRRTIRESEPTRPSTRVQGMNAEPTVPDASTVRVPREIVARRLRGDLDWITLKALEKDRVRRYASVGQLSDDIKRHLTNEPVMARPPSATYRVAKFVRRHKTGVAAGIAVALALVAGTVAASLGLVRARAAEELALDEAQRANRERDAAQQISNFMLRLFEINDPSAARGNEITVREILDRGAEQIRSGLSDRLLQARLLDTMGRVYQKLALYEQARPLLEEGLATRTELLGDSHQETADSLSSLGQLHYALEDYDRARELTERALEIRRVTLPPQHPDLGESLHNLGLLLQLEGDIEGARAVLDEASDIRIKTADDRGLGSTLHALGKLLRDAGQSERARQVLDVAVTFQRQNLAADHPDLARTLQSLAILHAEQKDYELARPLFEEALEIKVQAYGDAHPLVASTMIDLADLHMSTGDPQLAQPLYLGAVRILQSGPGDQLGDTLWKLAHAHRALGEQGTAERLFRLALETKRAAEGEDSYRLAYDEACYHALGGRSDEAFRLLRRSIKLGFPQPEYFFEDSDLALLHDDPELAQLVREAVAARAAE
ncbi:MAG: serine/threonine protein kinase [bacterium]|nr:serine/threonine protein kinase [bacterium]